MVFTIDLQRQLVNMAMKMCSKDVTFPFEHGVHPTILAYWTMLFSKLTPKSQRSYWWLKYAQVHLGLLVWNHNISWFGFELVHFEVPIILSPTQWWNICHWEPRRLIIVHRWHREGLRESRTWKNKSLNVCRLFDIVVAGKVRWQELISWLGKVRWLKLCRFLRAGLKRLGNSQPEIL